MTERELPPDWAWARLGDLGVDWRERVDPQPGVTYELWSVPAFSDDTPEVCDGTEILSSKISTQADDVLICKINPRINRVWRTRASHAGRAQIASPEWVVLRLPGEFRTTLAPYLKWYLSSPEFRSKITSGVSGVTGSHTRAKPAEILDQLVPIPPLGEQERIVDAIEDHLSRLEVAERTLLDVRRKVDRLQLSMLSEVFSSGKHRRVRLRDVAEVRLGRQRSPKNHTGDYMRPYVRAANVGWEGLLLDDVKEMNFSDKEADIFELRRGDILMNEASGSPGEVGKPAIWNDEIKGCCFQNTLIRLRPLEIRSKYLYHYLRFEALRGAFRSGTRGVGIHHLGSARIAEWMIPLPDSEEQDRMVESIESMREQTQRFQSQIGSGSNVRNRSYQLNKRILSDAFSGKLIPQDSSDEAASVLLERIRAERAAQVKPKRGRAGKKTASSARPAPSVSSEPTGTFVQEELGL